MRVLAALLVLVAAPAAAETPDGATILARAAEAAGGEGWANAKTLTLEGRGIFYGPSGSEPRSVADDYRMWRVFDSDRAAAHGAEGKVRILAKAGEKTLFTVGYDGATTWTERGVTPKAEADAFWASNFGFGIIRHAAEPGFKAERLPDDSLDGRRLYMVRLTDPKGGTTIFGIDASDYAIRSMGFRSPRGWHLRTYDDFVRLESPRWLQARKVTLYYDGVKANEVVWDKAVVDAAINPKLFEPPAE